MRSRGWHKTCYHPLMRLEEQAGQVGGGCGWTSKFGICRHKFRYCEILEEQVQSSSAVRLTWCVHVTKYARACYGMPATGVEKRGTHTYSVYSRCRSEGAPYMSKVHPSRVRSSIHCSQALVELPSLGGRRVAIQPIRQADFIRIPSIQLAHACLHICDVFRLGAAQLKLCLNITTFI